MTASVATHHQTSAIAGTARSAASQPTSASRASSSGSGAKHPRQRRHDDDERARLARRDLREPGDPFVHHVPLQPVDARPGGREDASLPRDARARRHRRVAEIGADAVVVRHGARAVRELARHQPQPVIREVHARRIPRAIADVGHAPPARRFPETSRAAAARPRRGRTPGDTAAGRRAARRSRTARPAPQPPPIVSATGSIKCRSRVADHPIADDQY